MKIGLSVKNRRATSAFTIVEVGIAVAIVGTLVVTLYTAIGFSFRTLQVTRTELRATQIMVEKLEAIRLYQWSQLLDTNFTPRTFTDYYYPASIATNQGIRYDGTLSVDTVTFSNSYADCLRAVTIEVKWNDGGRSHARQMTTFVASNGFQRYVNP